MKDFTRDEGPGDAPSPSRRNGSAAPTGFDVGAAADALRAELAGAPRPVPRKALVIPARKVAQRIDPSSQGAPPSLVFSPPSSSPALRPAASASPAGATFSPAPAPPGGPTDAASSKGQAPGEPFNLTSARQTSDHASAQRASDLASARRTTDLGLNPADPGAAAWADWYGQQPVEDPPCRWPDAELDAVSQAEEAPLFGNFEELPAFAPAGGGTFALREPEPEPARLYLSEAGAGERVPEDVDARGERARASVFDARPASAPPVEATALWGLVAPPAPPDPLELLEGDDLEVLEEPDPSEQPVATGQERAREEAGIDLDTALGLLAGAYQESLDVSPTASEPAAKAGLPAPVSPPPLPASLGATAAPESEAPFAPPAAAALPEAPAALTVPRVSGTRRVVVHTADGQVKRGVVEDLDLSSPDIALEGQPGQALSPLPAASVKAIFFMLPRGEPPAPAEGQRLRVIFRDGRQVAGFSSDYAPDRSGFFVVPADTSTHTERIWVYRSAVRQVVMA